MNKIIKELLDKDIIIDKNGIYYINDGYFIMVKDEYYGDLLLMSAIFMDGDEVGVCDNMSHSYVVYDISDLTISKAI
jgi:hypothetical protein